jgi:hypothetical protein
VRRVIYILLLICCVPSQSFCGPGGKGSGNGTRIYFGPAYGFYSVNPRHAGDPVNRTSIAAGFKREFRVDRSYQTYILIGAEYFLHGVGFNSYYFKPDSLQIYDGSMRYHYALGMQELVFPLEFKYLFKRADDRLFSPYVAIGYHVRTLLPATLRITDQGGKVKNDVVQMEFRHPLFNSLVNSGVHLALGWQKNAISSSKGSFYTEVNFRYGFSQYYFEEVYAPSSLFTNSTHLTLVVGLRF